ncbi:2-oxoglutarate (2OG) and Fe(II)-dependent oxygenase superfamily protein [Abeliophyllum distichum]|uniref:2-oxoglutarate (2OG) and Fe(II)-dependent oxygenase superfamily protein n=1 Tax=Abeliophyllum distichum TaxID=126358 RepID=A0ABD1TE60_9LAMI
MATMEDHVARWFDVQSVPLSHTFPPENRPGKLPFPTCSAIPIINLSNPERLDTVQKIIKASLNFGFFQVINHGVSECVSTEALNVLKELFNMPGEEISRDAHKNGWVHMGSTMYAIDGVHLWRDNIKHPCHPLEKCMQHWPQMPTREVMATYVQEMRRLSFRILELISEGLGLEKGYFEEISQVQFLSASNYPACPDPSVTLGVLKHFDHSLITILFQGNVEGLQVLHDGKWVGVGVVPNAFVVNIGTQLEIMSNGKLRSAEHRAVTNSEEDRLSIATFINPSPNCIIEPAKVLINESNPPLYDSFLFKDFIGSSKAFGPFTELVQTKD